MKTEYSFDEVQSRLKILLCDAEVKPGTKKGLLLERVYVMGMLGTGVKVNPAVEMMLLCGRSVAGYVRPQEVKV